MTEPDLNPCPFCGIEATAVHDDEYSSGWDVGCFNGECLVEPHAWAETKDEAIAAWNTRAVDPAAIREAALREALEITRTYGLETGDYIGGRILALIGEKK
jgi:hypothetical protein